jgi:hypothetical protein
MKNSFYFFAILSFSTIAQNKKTTLADNDKNANETARMAIVGEQVNSQNSNNSSQKSLMSFDTRYEGLKGTYYLIPTWLEGDLYGDKGTLVSKRVSIKYDVFNKEIILKKGEKDSIAVYPSAFVLYDNGYTYNFVHRKDLVTVSGKKIPNTYLQILFDDKIVFYKNRIKSLIRADYKEAYSDNRTYDSFEDNAQYFLKHENGDIEEIKLSKKSLLQAFESQKEQVENFIKINSLDLKKETDTIKLITFYTGLLPELKK